MREMTHSVNGYFAGAVFSAHEELKFCKRPRASGACVRNIFITAQPNQEN
jgi:hypothetical protein